MPSSRVRYLRLAGLALLALVGLIGLTYAYSAWQFRADLAEAQRELAAGRMGSARARFAALAARRPGRGEVEYPLGLCEEAARKPDAAVAAWRRVPSDSPFYINAALRLAAVAMDQGAYAEAESLARDALALPAAEEFASDLRQFLIQLLWHQARFDEVRYLIETNWSDFNTQERQGPTSRLALSTLRGHLSLDLEAYTLDRVKELLEAAATKAPNDDRVALALANLATRTGAFATAEPLLQRCLKERPRDPVVWRIALDLAKAGDQPNQALEAAKHLPLSMTPQLYSTATILKWSAWFAQRAGDDAAEIAALESASIYEPGDPEILERLAELAARRGDLSRLKTLRERKAAIDQAMVRYRALLAGEFLDNAEELARLAEILGRRFEARAFNAIVLKKNANDSEAQARTARIADPPPWIPPDSARTLADLLGGLAIPQAVPPSSLPSTTSAARLAFLDDAESSGLRFTYDNGRSTLRQLPETMSGGIAVLDSDGDGWLDVYCVQGGTFPPTQQPGSGIESPSPIGDRLFRNRRDGTFEDVTEKSGLGRVPGYGIGVTVGDYDNDGDADLFLTRYRRYVLYCNQGDGGFEDVTEAAGLGGDRDWPTSSAFADLDDDGDLDLYVCHYLKWDETNPRPCRSSLNNGYTYCDPKVLESLPDHVFRNDGGKFVDVTREAGFTDPDGRGLGVIAADFDGDHRIDLYVANDGTANFLFRNLGGFRFEEVGLTAGVAGNAEGGFQAGMGLACGDFNRDGRTDLVVTNFYAESSTYYQNLGAGLFADRTSSAGLLASTRNLLGFGTCLIDADNDGWLDLATTNGHVNDLRPIFPYAMPAQLLRGGPDGRFSDATALAGDAWSVPRVGRGLAAADLGNTGHVDFLFLPQNEPVALLRNRSEQIGHFLTLRLEGAKSNRDAIGAEVTIKAGGVKQVAQRFGGGSYGSASDPRLHIGLGAATKVDALTVRWPSGTVDEFTGLAVDRGYLISEGEPTAKPLTGFGEPR